MRYSVDIERDIDALACCLRQVSKEIDTWDWRVSINAGGIDYGIYFNFDIDRKELEICNQPRYDAMLSLDEIIDIINEYDEDEEED